MSESMTSERRLSAAEKQRQALELRKGGRTFEAIAEELGYKGVSGAYRAVTSALRRTLQEPADELRKLEVERLDALLEAVWPAAMEGEAEAVDRVLKVMARRAKLLGLDAPQTLSVSVIHRRAQVIADKLGVSVADVLAQAASVAQEAGAGEL